MVSVSVDEQGLNGHILLKPDLSLSWKHNARFIAVASIILTAISVYFVSIGGWMVLPFSGLEIIVISISLYLLFQRYNIQEVIQFSSDQLVIERGKSSPDTSRVFHRHWSKFYVHRHGEYDIPRVCLVSHGKELELGSFLGHEDKHMFIESLIRITRNFQRHF